MRGAGFSVGISFLYCLSLPNGLSFGKKPVFEPAKTLSHGISHFIALRSTLKSFLLDKALFFCTWFSFPQALFFFKRKGLLKSRPFGRSGTPAIVLFCPGEDIRMTDGLVMFISSINRASRLRNKVEGKKVTLIRYGNKHDIGLHFSSAFFLPCHAYCGAGEIFHGS